MTVDCRPSTVMTHRRWIADEVSGERAFLLGANARHLARVLRASVGQEYDVAAGGRVRRGRVVAVEDERVEFELGEEVAGSAVPEVVLLLAVFKFDRMEWAIEKAVELGVARIVPVLARRTDAHLAAAASKRVERWRRIAREAAQQSRRAAAPEVTGPVVLKQAPAMEGTRVVLAESEEQVTLKQALAGAAAPVVLAVGPEGGWTKDEMQAFRQQGWKAASLGATILRTETAAVAALAVAMAELQ